MYLIDTPRYFTRTPKVLLTFFDRFWPQIFTFGHAINFFTAPTNKAANMSKLFQLRALFSINSIVFLQLPIHLSMLTIPGNCHNSSGVSFVIMLQSGVDKCGATCVFFVLLVRDPGKQAQILKHMYIWANWTAKEFKI